MSSYMYFFVRKGDEFAPIMQVSRSSSIYNYFKYYAPYERIAPVSTEILRDLTDTFARDDYKVQRQREDIKKRIQRICTFNNSVEEKLRAIEEELVAMRELDECQDEDNIARNFIHFLIGIVDMAHQYNDYLMVTPGDIDPDKYIYVGIECGPAVDVSTIAK